MKLFKPSTILFLFCTAFFIQCEPSKNADNGKSSTAAATTDTETKAEATKKADSYRIGFYNVENLFDTTDDPDNGGDDEYLPTSEKKWTQERYDKKIKDLARVIAAMGTPAILGVCEVENAKVLEDLAADPQLANGNYAVAHRQSNDHRGIDNSLLYNKELFSADNITSTIINIPESISGQKGYTTRDIFYVEGTLGGDKVHLFVNHWPSRRGGEAESSPKREYVAGELKKMTDAILAKDENANIIIMGDLNDEPNNKSLMDALQAKSEDSDAKGELVNTTYALQAAGEGSYNYKGDWNMLDQIIVSDGLLAEDAALQHQKTVIFQEEWMLYRNKKGEASPNRTFGRNYYGGFSDHLPVYMELKRK